MDSPGETKIWVKYCKDTNDSESFELNEIAVKHDMTSKETIETILKNFKLSNGNHVVKIRNSRGNLIPINNQLAANSPKRAYTLEVCELYSIVKPRPRTVSLPTYQQLLRRRSQNIETRLLKLEQTVPRLPEIRDEILEKEISDLTSKMNFLNQKIKVVDNYQWTGMFQRNPLW